MLGKLARKGHELCDLQQRGKRSQRIPLPKMQQFWSWFLEVQGPTALSKTTKKT